MKIVIATANPVKIRAAQQGVAKIFPDHTIEMIGLSVPSDVSDQPMGDEETRQGAINRVRNVEALYTQQTGTQADLYLAIEGGCAFFTDIEGKSCLSAFAWSVAKNAAVIWGESRSASFVLPDATAALVQQGMELGHADDKLFGKSNSKQDTGSVGLLTGNGVTREELYIVPVALSLIKFKNIKGLFI